MKENEEGKPKAKKSYRPPVLTDYGDVRKLTQQPKNSQGGTTSTAKAGAKSDGGGRPRTRL